MATAVSFTAALRLESVAAVDGAGVATGADETGAVGVEVVVGVAALAGVGMIVVMVL